MTLRVWGRTTSSNVQALMWCIGELGLDFQRHDIGQRFGGNDTPEFLAMNPNGTVPVLCDGDGPALWETGAILRYLAARYGTDSFWPVDPLTRAGVDKWAEWAKINVAMAFTAPIFWRVVRTAPSQQDPVAIAHALAGFERVLSIAEAQLAANDFLAGDNFTLADIQFGHVLYRYFDIAIARPHWPHIQLYYAGLTQRPAFAAHVMVSYDDLRVRD
ncbi:glutathione S-transferase family protein [Devosia sp. CAU 1758]